MVKLGSGSLHFRNFQDSFLFLRLKLVFGLVIVVWVKFCVVFEGNDSSFIMVDGGWVDGGWWMVDGWMVDGGWCMGGIIFTLFFP